MLRQYAELVWDPDDIVEIRPLPAQDWAKNRIWVCGREVPEKFAYLKSINDRGANIYAGVIPRTKKNEGTADYCKSGKVLWADFDGGVEPREAWKKVKSVGLPDPTMVINSGHGAHLFWALTEKIDVLDISSAVSDLAIFAGSDPSVSDAARILRLPGFMNWKKPEKMAELIYRSNKRYNFNELRKIIPAGKSVKNNPADPAKTSSREDIIERARKYVEKMDGSSHPGRNKAAFRVASCLVRDFQISADEALGILTGWDARKNTPPINGDPQYKDGELERIIAHACKHAQKSPGNLKDAEKPRQESQKIEIQSDPSKDVSEMMGELEAQVSGQSNTIEMPWPRLSNGTKALKPGTVVVVAGPIKTGKSFLVSTLAMHLEGNSIPWAYLPLEDSKTAFLWRILSIVTGDYKMNDDDSEGAAHRAAAFERHKSIISSVAEKITQNPRVGHKDSEGNTIIPEIGPKKVIGWARAALKTSRVVFIDPISQIDFPVERQHEHEAKFIRELLAIAGDSRGTVVLVAHTVKRSGANSALPLSAEDVQGSAMLTRLCQTCIIIDGHEPKESLVKVNGGELKYEHNRTVTIAAARNGGGTRMRIAFEQGQEGPRFREFGVILKEKGKK